MTKNMQCTIYINELYISCCFFPPNKKKTESPLKCLLSHSDAHIQKLSSGHIRPPDFGEWGSTLNFLEIRNSNILSTYVPYICRLFPTCALILLSMQYTYVQQNLFCVFYPLRRKEILGFSKYSANFRNLRWLFTFYYLCNLPNFWPFPIPIARRQK